MPAFAAVAGREVRTGKRKPRRDRRTLKFAKYATLPRLPGAVVHSASVPAGAWGMMGNDRYGDCTVAAAGHAVQVATGVASSGSSVVSVSDEEILAAYWATGNPPTPGADDNGRVELDVLNYWRNVGIGGHQLHAFVSLDLKNFHGQIRRAIELFGFVYIGLGLPLSAQGQSSWSVVTGAGSDPWSWGGHAVVLVDYDRHGAVCVTWGELVRMTWGFFKKYCDEAYAVILPEWLNAAGDSVEGFDLAALDADLAALAA